MQAIKSAVRPQDDFYQYINGDWIDNHHIPGDRSIWGSFYELREKTNKNIRKIIEQIAYTPDDKLTAEQHGIKQFYVSAIKYDTNVKAHIKTIVNEIHQIEKISSYDQLAEYLGKMHRYNINAFWSCYIDYNDKDSTQKVFRISQGGLHLPNRDYYLQKNKRMDNIRCQYEIFFTQINEIFCKKYFNISWSSIIDIESKLAKMSWRESKLRDVNATYNDYNFSDIKSTFSKFNWDRYFINQNWPNPSGKIIINQPDYINGTVELICSSDLSSLKDYLIWAYINKVLDLVGKKYTKVFFDFYGKVLYGKKRQLATWKRAIQQMEDYDIICEHVSKVYVSKLFPAKSKQLAAQIAFDVKQAFHRRIDILTWMDPKSKLTAHKKLDNIDILVGYPDKWRNIAIPKLSNNLIQNCLSLEKAWSDYCISTIGKPVDRHEWHMEAHAVNACSEFNLLTVCFPAGILQPPFFNPKADYASNLGSFGSIVGHELTHSFDDQGIEFNEIGNMKKWLSKSEQLKFNILVKQIVEQANNFQILPGLKLNGQLVAGEAVADLGGIEFAVSALKLHFKNAPSKEQIKELFESYVRSECSVYRDEALINLVKTDPHPPSIFRVNGVLAHVDEFYNAYNIKTTDKLFLPPNKRAKIW